MIKHTSNENPFRSPTKVTLFLRDRDSSGSLITHTTVSDAVVWDNTRRAKTIVGYQPLEAPVVQSNIKVGQRVRVSNPSLKTYGYTGLVIWIVDDPKHVRVKLDSKCLHGSMSQIMNYSESNLEPIDDVVPETYVGILYAADEDVGIKDSDDVVYITFGTVEEIKEDIKDHILTCYVGDIGINLYMSITKKPTRVRVETKLERFYD